MRSYPRHDARTDNTIDKAHASLVPAIRRADVEADNLARVRIDHAEDRDTHLEQLLVVVK